MRRAPSTSAITFAASVLPTPASPSMKSGFSSLSARKIDVARPRSPMYRRSRRRRSISSMLAGAVIPLKTTGRSHDCPVEEPAAELDVLVRAVGDREHDLGDDLVGRERRSEEVLEEVLGLYRPLVGDDLGVEHQRDGRVVAGCVGVGDHATDRAHVADLVVTDLTGHLRQDWQLVLDRI